MKIEEITSIQDVDIRKAIGDMILFKGRNGVEKEREIMQTIFQFTISVLNNCISKQEDRMKKLNRKFLLSPETIRPLIGELTLTIENLRQEISSLTKQMDEL